MKRFLTWFVVLCVVVLGSSAGCKRHQAEPQPVAVENHVSVERAFVSDDSAVADAFEHQRSNVWVTVSGTVTKVLGDDTKGSKHQRFIVRLSNGMTLLVAHNIDIARRVPINRGDVLQLHGEYKYNKKGGVLHFTHRSTRGGRVGGWIQHNKVMYQ